MNPNAPAQLGRYQIIREIARSNDIVYEGYDPTLNRRVALKELSISGSATPQQKEERIRRFQREVKAAGSLAHPNIVTVHEFGEQDGRYYMAMEFLDGRTVRQELDLKGILPLERTAELVKGILSALDFAHKNGIIHRDIKPENMQILSTGQVKLTDFGIARLAFEPNLTIDGQIFGTPSYMSPEQIVGKDLDARSDLFSLGAVAYEMLTGQKAFSGDSVVSISYAIMNSEPDVSSLPLSVQNWLRKALQKVANMRFSDAGQMLDELMLAVQGATTPPQQTVFQPVPTASPYTYGVPTYSSNQTQIQQQPVAQPYSPPVQNPYPNFPTYIPPPPRPPLFSEQFKSNTKFLFGVIISISLVLGVIYAGMIAIGSLLKPKPEVASGSSVPAVAANPEEAAKWELSGKQSLSRGQYAEAREAFNQAIANDPLNAVHHTNLAAFYGQIAKGTNDPEDSAGYWKQAADAWQEAARLERSGERSSRFRDSAAISLFNAATRLEESGDKIKARAELARALEMVSTDGATLEAIRRKYRELGG